MLLLALGSLSGTGCLIAEAPSYGTPRRTVPVIDDLSVTPQPSYFLPITLGEIPPFTMTVRSEDAGEDLIAAWVIDYNHGNREVALGAGATVPARAADQPKTLTPKLKLDSRVLKGCHSLTLLVMHETSYDPITMLPDSTVSEGDVAAVTWFVNVDTGELVEPVPCPSVL